MDGLATPAGRYELRVFFNGLKETSSTGIGQARKRLKVVVGQIAAANVVLEATHPTSKRLPTGSGGGMAANAAIGVRYLAMQDANLIEKAYLAWQ